jgi:hypothetical protein
MKRFAICIDDRGCDDLQVGKVYKVFVDLPHEARRASTVTRRRPVSRSSS